MPYREKGEGAATKASCTGVATRSGIRTGAGSTPYMWPDSDVLWPTSHSTPGRSARVFPARVRLHSMRSQMPHILLVDLNNFAHYPSIAVGALTAALRESGSTVRVFSPLAHGVSPVPRERVESPLDHLERLVSFSTRPWICKPRKLLANVRSRWRTHCELRAMPAFRHEMESEPDLVLISAYTDSLTLAREMSSVAAARNVPVVIGGPAFSQPEVARAWTALPGVSAVVGAEFERRISSFCLEVLSGSGISPTPGVFLPNGETTPLPRAETALDELGLPDYSDFPWSAYVNRMVPVQMGRGCGWGRCRFCGDIVTANGRGFRSRTVRRVLDEMHAQAKRHDTLNFVFLDLKLNSSPPAWRELVSGIKAELPGARWIGSVHVESGVDCGLELDDLVSARAAGMVRVTFGLESGSQRILDAMDKGTTVERNKRFVREAAAAGLSVRATVIQGYPGESSADLDATASLLRDLGSDLDRVRANRLNVLGGTMLARDLERGRGNADAIENLAWEHEWARSSYVRPGELEPRYRRAKRRLLRAVHLINRKPLREEARDFHGCL